MTNYKEKLDKILAKLPQYNLGQDPITDKDFTPDETFAIYPELAEAKQDITSLIKELVAEAKPGYDMVKNSKRDKAINEFEQNLLKALEEMI